MTIHTYIEDLSTLVLIDDLVKIVNRYSFHTTRTLLISSSRKGHLDVVKYLHEYGANITAANNEAVREASSNGHLDVVKYLHKHGADITARNNYAVLWASRMGHVDVVKYLYEHMPQTGTDGAAYR